MSRLSLSLAIGDYDRNRPLLDGAVRIDGVDIVPMMLTPEEIFFRSFRDEAFDICELSLSSMSLKTAQGTPAYVGVPAFVSRAFRHTSIYIRTDRGIRTPQDLKGRRIGLPEYQLTACVWVRALLDEDYGVRPSDVTWVRGGIVDPSRVEKIAIELPPEIRLEAAPAGKSLDMLLQDGEIDAYIGPRAPPCFERGHPAVARLFADPTALAQDYYRRTGIFPIMHLIGVRRSLVEAHPWLPATVLKAFEQSKAMALAKLADTSATKVTLPFVEEQLAAARALMGPDFWSYGFAPNKAGLDNFLEHHHRQGLSKRRVRPEELFHPSTLDGFKL
jgi:4,5-dihydroxyphthalate decarboxylase